MFSQEGYRQCEASLPAALPSTCATADDVFRIASADAWAVKSSASAVHKALQVSM